MSRTTQIDDAAKVTLYMPTKVTEAAKVFANNKGTSLSRLVTQLLEERMGGVVQHTVEITPECQKKLAASAKSQGVLIKDLIPKLVSAKLDDDSTQTI